MIDPSDLPRMAAFAVIVREGSFTAAARVLGTSKASLSEQLRKLETRMGARLLQRTTRRLSLTEAGEACYRRCAQIVEEAERAMVEAGAAQTQPTGTLRLTAPHAMGAAVVIPAIVRFTQAYPDVRVDLRLSDVALDLLEHDLDLAIRGGWPESSSLIAKKLGDVPQYLCTSPAHLARAAPPASVADLASHLWVVHTAIARDKICVFTGPRGEQRTATITRATLVNSTDAIRHFLLRGHGIGVLPAPMAEPDLQAGGLVRLLADHALPKGAMYAVYPSREHLSPKVQRFIQIVTETLAAESASPSPRRAGKRKLS
jgi:DNA-binding transcriptional LysR family regulator